MTEFALIAPVFMLILVGMLVFGRLLFYWIETNHVASETARWAVVDRNPYSPRTLQQSAQSRATNEFEENAAVCIDFPDPNNPGQFQDPAAGEVEAGVRGGPPGDLYIFLSLATHEFFQRDGADLHCRVPISMVAAALGGEFEVPTIENGKTKVKVPPGTQSGRRFRIASKGMPVLRSRQTGDMYVQVMVETPQNLTKKQQELLSEFEKLSSGATQPEAAGFFTKVKDFFGNRAS